MKNISLCVLYISWFLKYIYVNCTYIFALCFVWNYSQWKTMLYISYLSLYTYDTKKIYISAYNISDNVHEKIPKYINWRRFAYFVFSFPVVSFFFTFNSSLFTFVELYQKKNFVFHSLFMKNNMLCISFFFGFIDWWHKYIYDFWVKLKKLLVDDSKWSIVRSSHFGSRLSYFLYIYG